MDEFGPTGYLAWFGLIEIIAKESGSNLTGKLSIRATYLSRKLRISSTKLQRVFNHCSTSAKLSFSFCEGKFHFVFPKILHLKDNYQKDLQESGNSLSHHKEVEEEVDKEKEKNTKKNPDVEINQGKLFEEIWAKYPKRDGKKYALKHFRASVKTYTDWAKINQALGNYMKSGSVNDGYIKNGSTWFNNWQDYINWVEPKKPAGQLSSGLQTLKKFDE